MLVIELEPLLAPVSEETPAGPDLGYDPDFAALETAARGKSEQQFGDTVIPAEEPNWRDVIGKAEALLARSKDLRVAILAARAATRMDNVEGLALGLELIKEICSRYWDSLHPDLDHEDADDPTMRLNALAPLADPETFLRDVRNASLAASPQHGRVTIRDILIAQGKMPAGAGTVLSENEIDGILRAIGSENPRPFQAALECVEHVKGLESLLGDKGVLTQAPDLRALIDLLQTAAATSRQILSVVQPDAIDAPEGEAVAPGQQARAAAPGQILSREDVVRVLDNVCKFIEQSEPSNPAPLLIRRAQRLMSRNFIEIMQDLAPESVEQIQKLAGLE
jgi:type VI secretion system protein ImpA